MSTLIEHIVRYVLYLQDTHGLTISIHAPDHHSATGVEQMIELTAHRNPYCCYIKSQSNTMWDACIHQQSCVMRSLKSPSSFFGMCHAGVCEFIYPFGHRGILRGCVCVSGYRPAEDSPLWSKACYKLNKLTKQSIVPYKELMQIYKRQLSPETPSTELLDTLIEPLCDMLALAISENKLLQPTKQISSPQVQLYQELCNILKNYYNTDIRIATIAEHLHYSESYISHIFRKFSGETINQYVTKLRIKEAKILLADTELPVQEISLTVGYNDSNYFTNVFRHLTGVSPRQWRAALNDPDAEKTKK